MTLISSIYEYFVKLNFFDTETDDAHEKRNEILSTRMYIIALTIILSLFLLYLSLTSQSTLITISQPTKEQFQQLELKHSTSLKCPCKELLIPYGDFINIRVKYNEICSSNFISQEWIDYFYFENISYYHPLDFRRNAPFKFQLLRTLCQQAKQTVDNNLEQFYSNGFVVHQPTSMNTLHIQVNSFSENLKKTTFSSFQNVLRQIRQVLRADSLQAAIDTRYFMELYEDSSAAALVHICYRDKTGGIFTLENVNNNTFRRLPERIYSNTDKYDYYSTCFNNTNQELISGDITPTLEIPGMFTGVLLIESLMYSTLECLFDQTCLNNISLYVHASSIPISRFSVLTHYPLTKNQSIEFMADRSFVEEWVVNTSYENYFNYCQPLFCEYTAKLRNSFLYIFTTTISLFGGLRIFLPLIIINIVTFLRKKKQQQPTNTSRTPIKTRLCIFLKSIKNLIMKLNIFNSYSSDEHRQKTEIISTRVYFLLLTTCLVAFTVNIYSEKQTTMIIINGPTQIKFEELQKESVDDLQCPCSNISVKYSEFIHFSPTYHQICSSVFVSPLWEPNENIWIDKEPCYSPDFYSIAQTLFPLLSTYCQMARITLLNELKQFYDRQYTTTLAVTEEQFNHEIKSFIEIFQITVKASFDEQLGITQSIIFDNQIYSELGLDNYVNGIFFNDSTEFSFDFGSKVDDECSCAIEPDCAILASFCRDNRSDDVPGVYAACYTIDSLLYSTTECFYDQDCIDLIRYYLKNETKLYEQIQPLNESETSRYQTKDHIAILVGDLFVENWNEFHFYDKYYNSCQSSFCSYKIQQRPQFIHVLTVLINVYGGLTIILRFLIPNIVSFIRRKRRQRQGSIFHEIRITLRICLRKLQQLNLFRNQSNNLHIIRQQIIIFYTSLNKKIITNTIQLTNLAQYKELHSRYRHSLSCACNEVSIKYKEFINLMPIYSEVCSSYLVDEDWIDSLYRNKMANDHGFYAMLPIQFHFLASVCQLTAKMVDLNLKKFHSTTWISNELNSMDLFQNKVNKTVNSFKRSTALKFKEIFDMNREIIHGNTFISALQTNWKYIGYHFKNNSVIMYTKPISYNNQSCTCATSLQCSEPMVIDHKIVEGLFIGCYPVETMLQSSLQCFYNKSCYNSIMPDISAELMPSVDQSERKYLLNETVQQMVDRLFVDEWHFKESYQNYFEKCRATHCTYSFTQNFNILVLLRTILQYYGGLDIILSVVISFIVHIIFRIYYRRSQILVVPKQSTTD
ncbi:unnamed protein product [Adineta ricciae]|uniref:Uncharacterized protein n=1 Tax=Adineta ricciae TaxID=249248 RepID=A0A816C6J5_ADIRI|nr:unnamed protein product [Adineta ricciae]